VRGQAFSRTVGLIFALACLPLRASAYRTLADEPDQSDRDSRIVWRELTVSPALHDSVPHGLLVADVHEVLRRALSTWEAPECSLLHFPSVTVTSAPAISGDEASVVQTLRYEWPELGLPSDVAATTDILLEVDGDGHWWIVDADVLVNDQDFDWSVSPQTAPDGPRDLRAVLTHEVGHLAGLEHPCGDPGIPACESDPIFAELTMRPDYVGAPQSDLAADDIAGICHLYPTSDCGRDTCPVGQACVLGGCRTLCGSHVCAAGTVCENDECVPAECANDACPTEPRCDDAETTSCGHGELDDPCAGSDECLSGFCGDGGTCAQPCDDHLSCPEGYECTNHECASLAPTFGEQCNFGEDCASGLCLNAGGDDAFCTRECGVSCPGGYQCTRISEREVCAPIVGGGCSTVRAGKTSALTPLLALLLLRRMVRRRRIT
jgi:hypothetical protein